MNPNKRTPRIINYVSLFSFSNGYKASFQCAIENIPIQSCEIIVKGHYENLNHNLYKKSFLLLTQIIKLIINGGFLEGNWSHSLEEGVKYSHPHWGRDWHKILNIIKNKVRIFPLKKNYIDNKFSLWGERNKRICGL